MSTHARVVLTSSGPREGLQAALFVGMSPPSRIRWDPARKADHLTLPRTVVAPLRGCDDAHLSCVRQLASILRAQFAPCKRGEASCRSRERSGRSSQKSWAKSPRPGDAVFHGGRSPSHRGGDTSSWPSTAAGAQRSRAGRPLRTAPAPREAASKPAASSLRRWVPYAALARVAPLHERAMCAAAPAVGALRPVPHRRLVVVGCLAAVD
jgi:hypothetical protein